MAGSFGEINLSGNDIYSGAMFAARIPFTSDATDGTVADKSFVMPHGSFLADVDFVHDGTMTLEVVVKTVDGIKAHPNDTVSNSADDRYILTDRPSLIGGFQLSLTTAGVADAGKSGIIVLNMASNKR